MHPKETHKVTGRTHKYFRYGIQDKDLTQSVTANLHLIPPLFSFIRLKTWLQIDLNVKFNQFVSILSSRPLNKIINSCNFMNIMLHFSIGFENINGSFIFLYCFVFAIVDLRFVV